jgi:hypothetical protein
MILVPLFDLKFLTEFAATAVGTSNRRHWQYDGQDVTIGSSNQNLRSTARLERIETAIPR